MRALQPDGYAVATQDGAFVGLYKTRESAEICIARSPQARGERIVDMVFAFRVEELARDRDLARDQLRTLRGGFIASGQAGEAD